jgi:rhodanese-related sulfurtransferase
MSDLHAVSTPTAAGFREIPVAAASEHLGAFALLDVREADEFTGELGHVAGAQLVPLGTVPAVAPTLDRSKTWLVICRSGGRSGRAAGLMASQGFTVYNLTGGMLAWNGAGKPVER